MRVLVTGANGFVGRPLCHVLLKKGCFVKGMFRSGEKCIKYSDNMECVAIGEINSNTDWAEPLKGVDAVVHLAARVHVMQEASTDTLTEYRRVNTDGTKRLAEIAAGMGVRRLIYVSTVKVNGETTGHRVKGLGQKAADEQPDFSEDDIPDPKDPYAVSKWEAEQVLNNIAAETGLEVVVLRPPLVYGPHVKANFLKMLQLVDRGVPLPLMNVHNNRSLIYVNNLVDAISLCITHPKAVGETFLVSDGQDVSTPKLIRMIASAMGKKPRLIPFPISLLRAFGKFLGKSQEMERLTGSLCVDSSKIRRTLGWKPPFTLEEGVGETVGWYKDKARSEIRGRRSEVRHLISDF
jgi:nucleoside-diphosphate-sugar epimerase